MKVFALILIVVFAIRGGYAIVGGHDAKPCEYPYHVTIQYKLKGEWYHVCSGAILDELSIATARHCFKFEGEYRVIAGSVNLDEYDATKQERRVASLWTHPGYFSGSTAHDITKVTLDNKLELNDCVKGVTLGDYQQEHLGDAILTGWGARNMLGNRLANILQAVTLPVLPPPDCEDDIFYVESIGVCVGPLNHSIGPCFMDDGAPLVQNNELISIVTSVGRQCGKLGRPAIFSKVTLPSS